jgi:lipoprotein Spr
MVNNKILYRIVFFIIIGLIFQSCQPSIRFASNENLKISKEAKVKSKKNNSEKSDNDIDDISNIDKSTHNIIDEAESWIGTPYVYGGNSRNGIDCSALVCQVYQSVGETVPRTSQQQFEYVKQIEFVEKKPGDLLFFKNNRAISHVGIYVGNGYMIHASTSSGVIKQSIFESYFMDKLAGVGRLKSDLTKNLNK